MVYNGIKKDFLHETGTFNCYFNRFVANGAHSPPWFADKFGVSVRTIYRDIESLENAGIPIVTYTGINGGIAILDTYKIDKKLFTHQDITTLLTSLQSISSSMSEASINQTLEKIKGLIPKEHSKSIQLSSRQLYVDMTPWASNPIVSDNLSLLQNALSFNKLVRFDYNNRYQSSSQRLVEPHQLVLKEGSWYLKAYCKEKCAFRTFKLSRINALQIVDEVFSPREFESGMEDFKTWQHEQMIIVELIADDSIRERALDFCRPEYVTETDDGHIHIKMPFVESDMGYGVLLSFGHHCKILSPPHVREELLRRIQLLTDVYLE